MSSGAKPALFFVDSCSDSHIHSVFESTRKHNRDVAGGWHGKKGEGWMHVSGGRILTPVRLTHKSLTDSGRRSTLIWSPSSKPSGTLFCINSGMLRLRFLSDSASFLHCSSCLRDSASKIFILFF